MARLDNHTLEVSVDIEAPIETVWDLVSDINLSAHFQSEFIGAEWIGNERGPGSAFVGRNERKGHAWETTCYVVAHDPPHAFGWAVDDREAPGATWTFRLEEIDGGTLLRYERVIGPGPSYLRYAVEKYPEREEEIVATRSAEHAANMQLVIDGVKRLAEGSAG